MNTPDTEWEKDASDTEVLESVADKIEELYQSRKYDAEFRKKLIINTLASHTTYWKERVRKVSYEVVKEFQDSLITIAIENEHMRGCVTSNQIIQAFKDFEASTHPALDTLLDNLK